MKLPWIVAADWQNEPAQLAESPWNVHVRGEVHAWNGEGGTCRASSGTVRTIDFFWVQRELRAALKPVCIDPNAEYRPHRPSFTAVGAAWSAYRVREIKLPRQFPLERPLGCLPPGGPRPEVGGVVDQVAVDRAWQGFCEGAEEDLIGIFGFDEAEGKKYCGRGEPTRFVWRRILPVQRAGIGRSSLARAWEWLAKELAWAALLMGR